MRNVTALLRGNLRPVNGWYQGLSYLPQAALLALSRELHHLTGWKALAVLDPGGFTPWAYFLCRFLPAIFGTLSLLATYVLGKKLFPEAVAVLGVLFLAVTPRHLHASALFKPDILLLLWTVVAFVWILEAFERPSARRYLLAGLGVGLCMATKLNGGLVAVPFAAGTVPLLGKVRRVWLWLIGAGAIAAAVFLLFDPFVGMQVTYFQRNLKHYESRTTTNHVGALLQIFAFLFSDLLHGWVIGTAAMLGGGWMAVSAFRRGWRDVRGLQELVFLSYPFFYSVLYVTVTTRSKQNHFLQLIPFTSLLAAFFLVGALSWFAERRSGLVVKRVVLAALAGYLSVQTAARVYQQAVPEGRARANRLLHRKMPQPRRGRLIYTEAAVSPVIAGKPYTAGGLRSFDHLETIPGEVLDLADAEVFSLSAAGSAFSQGRIASAAGPVFSFKSRPFRTRGEDVGVLLHPWTPAGSRTGVAHLVREKGRQGLAGTLPLEATPGEILSLGLWLPGRVGWKAELIADGQRLDLARLERRHGHILYLSTRFLCRNAPGEVVLRVPEGGKDLSTRVNFTVYSWKQPSKAGLTAGEAGVVR